MVWDGGRDRVGLGILHDVQQVRCIEHRPAVHGRSEEGFTQEAIIKWSSKQPPGMLASLHIAGMQVCGGWRGTPYNPREGPATYLAQPAIHVEYTGACTVV